jgi:hypothetical protein
MLCCKNSSFWSETQTVRPVPQDLENSSQKTRSTYGQNSFGFARANFSSTTNPCQYKSTPSSHGPRFESSVPESSSKVRPKEIHSRISLRAAYPFARWNLVRFQESTLDSLSGSHQIEQRSSCYLSGPVAYQRGRKPKGMDAIHRNDSSKGQKTYSRRRVRQFSRRQEARLSKSLDTSTVSFSLNPSIPIEKRTLEAWNWSPKDSGINLSTRSSSPGTSRWSSASAYIEALEHYSTPCANNSTAHASSRILAKQQLLPKLSKSSIIESAKHDQHYRINEPINPRSDASMWQSTNSRIAQNLDNSLYTYEASNDL